MPSRQHPQQLVVLELLSLTDPPPRATATTPAPDNARGFPSARPARGHRYVPATSLPRGRNYSE